jgi:2-polyprenyl-6-methoxyphenol hydroxylase-like FAD-dependent oxidoreductase
VGADADDAMDRYDETWGAGFVIGTYPVPGRVGVFVGGPVDRTRPGPRAFADHVAERLRETDERTRRSLQAVRDADDPYFWTLDDVRAARWSVGRVQLLGDAAAGFLPTAGIGAGMAVETAHGLAAHLLASRDVSTTEALAAFERVHRPRVEAAQDNSRSLARLLARDSAVLAAARDLLTRFIPPRLVMGPISNLLEERPVLPAQA